MHEPHNKHDLLGDELFRQVIAAEVDAVDNSLAPDKREQCITAVTEYMQAEIVEHLSAGDLHPETVNLHIRFAVERVVRGTDATAA